MSASFPENVTFYNFTAVHPSDGHCEWKYFGSKQQIAEPVSTLFGLMTSLLGIWGLIKSRHVAVGSRYIFSLLLGYGVSSAGHTATLWNGFDKTSGCLLNLMQAILITRLINSMKFMTFLNFERHFYTTAVIMSTFGLYPVIAHVIGSSFDNPWVSWLTFDLIWAALLIIVATIFINRKYYPQFSKYPDVFYLIFNATTTCVAAYAFWLVDTFWCCHHVVTLFYGLWLVLMGLTFYYLAFLDAFLQSSWQGYDPVITRWPKQYLILYVHVQWKHSKTKEQ